MRVTHDIPVEKKRVPYREVQVECPLNKQHLSFTRGILSSKPVQMCHRAQMYHSWKKESRTHALLLEKQFTSST